MNSLGINKPNKETKVVVAMSGGVDSSVVAALMKEEGYDVTGITLKLYDDTKQSKGGRQCCAGQDILDAKRVSDNININHKILFYQKKFKSEVIDSFIDSYAAGETPIPCVQCNQTVKFRDLFKYAKDLKADALVTGHYVARKQNNGHANMYRAKDHSRDQSYFLFSTTQEQLDYLRFPLGGIDKLETRSIAEKLNLNVAQKPDSQDICFVPNGDYASVIKRFRPESFKPGKILNIKGNQIGEHEGIINYTIGQRKGIKIASNNPLYVINIDADKNIIIVGNKECLEVKEIKLRELNILGSKEEFNKIVNIKVRSTGRLLKAKINLLENSANVEILDKETGISPGQACVFYTKDDVGDKVLGGGWIHKTFNKNLST
ncbi:tRNA 2-thiouridine(34) synthase MnmA [Candidatus Pelagibacter bacterium]|mgnify:FL=1|jgi:tRNA-uridine 2-sulfurtransferase|nr:tRNA 2-thiouridine(34) synthase MnmA [Candidatus Pelagibacter bacterium]